MVAFQPLGPSNSSAIAAPPVSQPQQVQQQRHQPSGPVPHLGFPPAHQGIPSAHSGNPSSAHQGVVPYRYEPQDMAHRMERRGYSPDLERQRRPERPITNFELNKPKPPLELQRVSSNHEDRRFPAGARVEQQRQRSHDASSKYHQEVPIVHHAAAPPAAAARMEVGRHSQQVVPPAEVVYRPPPQQGRLISKWLCLILLYFPKIEYMRHPISQEYETGCGNLH